MKYLAIILLFIMLGCSINGRAQTIDTVCTLSKHRVYMITATPGSIYYWSISCGTIVSKSPQSDSITVDWCSVPGVYEIKVVEKNKSGCWGDTVTAQIMVQGGLQLLIKGPSECCIGDAVILQTSGASKFVWSTGETSSKITVRPKDSTKYSVMGYNACNNKTDTASIFVKVFEKPKASFTYDPKNPQLDEMIFFHYTGYGASDWTWYFGGKGSLGGKVYDPKISFSERGNKMVTLVARNNAGCLDSFTYMLHVATDSKIFVPNVFTPNANGTNDVFRAIGYNLETIHMQIYNRWGELIFESDGLEEAWDGTYKGEKVIEGVYLYMIDATAKDKEHYYLHGSVTLLY
jgi:gliding motility-associated-like protein